MSYAVLYSGRARADLMEIYEYIAFGLMEPRIAAGIYEGIMSAVRSLEEFPMRNALMEDEPWLSRGLRRISVKNYLVFYTVDDKKKTVHIIRIMYGARDIDNQLSEHETTD